MPLIPLFVGFCFFLGYSAQGLTGFGGALMAVPLLSLVVPPREAVVVFNVVSFLVDIPLVLECRKEINLRRIAPVLAGATIGLPAGTYILAQFASTTLMRIMGGLVIVTCLMFFKKMNRKSTHEVAIGSPLGLVSGVLSGATGMGGPPVMFWAINQEWPERELRANSIFYFSSLKVLIIPMYLFAGLITAESMRYGLVGIPGLAVAFLLVMYLKPKVLARRNLLTKICLGLLFATGISILVRSFF